MAPPAMRRRTRSASAALLSALALAVPAALMTTSGPAAAATSWPTATGQQSVSATIKVSGSLDGKLVRYIGSGDLGSGNQDEDQDPIFELSNGATLQNVIIGAPAADGIHCLGSCTLKNVWWEDVGEDAATFKGTSASQTMTIDGGGARKADDKVFQHNGPGTMVIKNFQVNDFGKLYRSCGNCSSQFARHVQISNVTVTAPGKAIAGINTNFGDTATLSSITVVGDSSHKITPCLKYKGVTSGEPTETGSGPDSKNCLYSTSDITYK
jgi:pectate lyase